MKEILLFLSLSLMLFKVSGQVLFDESGAGLVNGETWYSFGNSDFSSSYYPLEAFGADPYSDLEEREYFGVGNARYGTNGEEVFGLTGKPENNFIRIVFSAGSQKYPTSLDVRLRVSEDRAFSAYLYQDDRPSFEERVVILALEDFRLVGNDAVKMSASDMARLSSIQFVQGFVAYDENVGFTIHEAEFVKGRTQRVVIYDGTPTALVNGDWYEYGNEDTKIINQHPVRVSKVMNTIYTPETDDLYYGIGNARYGENGTESFGLAGEPSASYFEIKLSYYSAIESRLDIRFKGAGDTEYTYTLLDWGMHDIHDELIRVPVVGVMKMPGGVSISAQELETLFGIGFNIGYWELPEGEIDDEHVYMEVNEVAFGGLNGFCELPEAPVFAYGKMEVCPGAEATVSIESGRLNDAENWFWYTEGCGEASFGQGASVTSTFTEATEVFVRGEGGGECELLGPCASILVEMTPFTLDEEVVEIVANTVICDDNLFILEASSMHHDEAPLYQWFLNGEFYDESPDKMMTFEDLEQDDRIQVRKNNRKECSQTEYSPEYAIECLPAASYETFMGISSAYVSGGRLIMRIHGSELYGDIQVTSASGAVLGRMENANLQETISMPVVSGTGLMIINLVTDKGVYNQKLFVR